MSQQWIAGRNPVLEAIKSERDIHQIFIAEGSQKGSMQTIIKAAKNKRISVQMVPRQKIDRITKENHQGVVAEIAAYAYAELSDLFERAASRQEEPFFLVLDELEDPHNLGSILRTADASGVHGIIIPKRRAVGLTSTVAKLSTGAIEHVPVVRVTNLARTIDELKERGIWVFGTDAKESADYRQMDASLPLAIVIGSEGKGISRLLREKCDFRVQLPMAGHVTSLNASVAAALLMYEVYRKRSPVEG